MTVTRAVYDAFSERSGRCNLPNRNNIQKTSRHGVVKKHLKPASSRDKILYCKGGPLLDDHARLFCRGAAAAVSAQENKEKSSAKIIYIYNNNNIIIQTNIVYYIVLLATRTVQYTTC